MNRGDVYRFTDAEKTICPVRLLCRLLGVGHSAFYDWLRQGRQRAAEQERRGQQRVEVTWQWSSTPTPEQRWKFLHPGPGGSHSVEGLVSMLQMLWPNPDRHASGGQRNPAIEEARAVVHLSILIVQWLRSGGLTLASS